MDFDIDDEKNSEKDESDDDKKDESDNEKHDDIDIIENDDNDNDKGTIDYTFDDAKVKRKVKKRIQSEIKYIKSNKKEKDRNINKFLIKTKNKFLRQFFITKLREHVLNISEKFEQLIYNNAVLEYSNTQTSLSFDEFFTNSFYNIFGLLIQCYEYPKNDKDKGKINRDKLKNILNDLLAKKINFTLQYFNDSREKYLLDFKISTSEIEIEEGIYTCNKCGKNKTTKIQLQTRSADEPMTNFIRCINCGSKWRD